MEVNLCSFLCRETSREWDEVLDICLMPVCLSDMVSLAVSLKTWGIGSLPGSVRAWTDKTRCTVLLFCCTFAVALMCGRRLFSINTEDTRKQSFSMETYPCLICVCILLKLSRYTEAATTSFSSVIFADSLPQPGQQEKREMMLGILWTFSFRAFLQKCETLGVSKKGELQRAHS